MNKHKLLALAAGFSVVCAGCFLSADDYVVTGGHEGLSPAAYVTFRLNASAQLLLFHNMVCKGDGACTLGLMKSQKPAFCAINAPIFGCVGQAEYDEAFKAKYGAEFAQAVSQVASVNAPAACVRVEVWKYPVWTGIETGVRWKAINNGDCQPGGDLTK